jgi:hypothetical protein
VNANREVPREPGELSSGDELVLWSDIDPRIHDVVTALRAPGTPTELVDEDHYLQLYQTVGPGAGKSLRPIVIGGRAAVVAVIGVLTVAGVAAAHSGVLPGPLQFAPHPATTSHRPHLSPDKSPGTGASSVAARSTGAAAPGADPAATGPRGAHSDPSAHPHPNLRPKPAKETHGKTKQPAPHHHNQPSKSGKAHGKGKPAGHGHPTKAPL